MPFLAFAELLAMNRLLMIAFAVGACTVLTEVAYQSYVPVLLDRGDLVKANSKLTASTSVAEIGGPGLGGLLIGALTAPVVIVLDAVSFVFSAVTIGLVRHRERRSPRPATAGIARQIGDGFRETVRNRSLLAFAGEAATYNVAWHALEVLLVLWAVTELGLTPATLGLLLSIGSVGALLGALLTTTVARRFGIGRTMWVSAVISNLGVLLIPLADAGSWAGQLLGLQPAITICALALFPSWLWLYLSPARRLRDLPATDHSEEPIHDHR